MLVEMGLVEQRYKAVTEVLVDGATVSGVAQRAGVSRQTLHAWLRRYASSGWPAWRTARRGRPAVRIRSQPSSRWPSSPCAAPTQPGARGAF